MKEHPILFSSEMVQAILEGRKTQTRRVLKIQPNPMGWCHLKGLHVPLERMRKYCPYGQVGDRLWVRETYYSTVTNKAVLGYKADGKIPSSPYNIHPSIFMPRWASRITLKITDIKVQRLQEIGVRDALAEGVEYDVSVIGGDPVSRYQELWDKINGKKHSWYDNPWVWCISFKRV